MTDKEQIKVLTDLREIQASAPMDWFMSNGRRAIHALSNIIEAIEDSSAALADTEPTPEPVIACPKCGRRERK